MKTLHFILAHFLWIVNGHLKIENHESQKVELLDSKEQLPASFCPSECTCRFNSNSGKLKSLECDELDIGSLSNSNGELTSLKLSNCVGTSHVGDTVNQFGLRLEDVKLYNCGVNIDWLMSLHYLKFLSISHTRLAEVAPSCDMFRHLVHLDLSATGLTNFPSNPSCTASPLSYFNLSSNSLSSFDWQALDMFPNLKTVDLSDNTYLSQISSSTSQFFHLSSLLLRGASSLTTLCNSILHSVPNVKTLDLTTTGLKFLPSLLFQLDHLETLRIDFEPECSCDWAVLLPEVVTRNIFSDISCRLPVTGEVVRVSSPSLLPSLACSEATIDDWGVLGNDSIRDRNVSIEPSSRVILDCISSGTPSPSILWLTPRYELLKWVPDAEPGCSPIAEEVVLNSNIQAYSQWEGHLEVLANGSLVIDAFGWRDRGEYLCYVDNTLANMSATIQLDLKYQYRNVIYYWSLAFGLFTATAFLALTLLGKLLTYLLWNYGCAWCCPCTQACAQNPPPKAKKLTRMVDSIEQYRIGQLEKLRENYNSQSERIRDNYNLQMERVREHYSSQTRGVGEGVQVVKDQYTEQVTRLRDYSNGQLAKSYENYIFQRQRLRKFSAQNYLKIRETGKYTQKTLNRVLENMPALYVDLTSCRQGQWAGEQREEGEDFRDDPRSPELEMIPEEVQSLYFTPSGTPSREMPHDGITSPMGRGKKGHKRMVSNLSNFFPFWWGMGQANELGNTVAIVEHTNESVENPSDLLGDSSVSNEEDASSPNIRERVNVKAPVPDDV